MATKKTCFIIMPISDQDGYDKGHFSRVYDYIIKPACEKAGFRPIRADEEAKTNHIVADIIKKILDSDMVVCDLSAKNPNVLYELGLRQAFNKKVVLIKDKKTGRIFDIQGLRTLDYDESLRIDEVNKSIEQVSKTILETSKASVDSINSLVQLLSIKPANIPDQINISQESSLILDSLNDISNRLKLIEKPSSNSSSNRTRSVKLGPCDFFIGEKVYDKKGLVGELVDIHSDSVFFKKDNTIIKMMKNDEVLSDFLPF
jgi:hypothetical protein